MAKKNNKDGGLDGKFQLAAINKNKNACWDGGKPGHKKGDAKCTNKGKGLDMPSRSKPNKGKACATCGKIHKGPCWEDPRNVHLWPKGWKSSKDSAEVNAAPVANNNELLLCSLCTDDLEEQGILESSMEMCLAGLTFPKDINLLQDPNIFVVDTGSTCHSTKYDTSLTNLRKADQNHMVTMANSAKESSTKVGDLKGIICNKEGQEVSVAIMKEVTYLPGGHFNLFSCSRLQQEDWILCTVTRKGNQAYQGQWGDLF
jgi:hypothetical protein